MARRVNEEGYAILRSVFARRERKNSEERTMKAGSSACLLEETDSSKVLQGGKRCSGEKEDYKAF
jgi:dienelactone hydrolase